MLKLCVNKTVENVDNSVVMNRKVEKKKVPENRNILRHLGL